MKKVDHPNCIKLHEVYDEKSKMYMVLDLVTGGELFDRLRTSQRLVLSHFFLDVLTGDLRCLCWISLQ